MPRDLQTCERAALQLKPRDRAVLAEHLIASLEALDEAGNEQVWIEEAERRYDAYKKGLLTSSPMDEVVSRVRRGIR